MTRLARANAEAGVCGAGAGGRCTWAERRGVVVAALCGCVPARFLIAHAYAGTGRAPQ